MCLRISFMLRILKVSFLKMLKIIKFNYRLISYCLLKLDLLLVNNIIPIVIFDGNRLSMKSGTEDERQKNRDEAMKKALEY